MYCKNNAFHVVAHDEWLYVFTSDRDKGKVNAKLQLAPATLKYIAFDDV